MENGLRYNVIFRPEPEGGFTVVVPSLPGCVSYGEDLQEAKTMIVDAIHGYIVSLRKHKEVIPVESLNAYEKLTEIKNAFRQALKEYPIFHIL